MTCSKRDSKTIVFIVGTPFCGSTLLGNLINAFPNASFIGEVDRLTPFKRYEKLDPKNHVNKCALCVTHPTYDCPFWSSKFVDDLSVERIVDGYGKIIDRVATPVVVDGSKTPNWLADLYDMGLEHRVLCILAARLPWAFVRSNYGAVGSDFISSAIFWRDTYMHALRVVAGRGIPSMVVRYEDLCFLRHTIMRKVAAYIELDFDDCYQCYYDYELHALGGNTGAYLRYQQFDKNGWMQSTPSATRDSEAWKLAYYKDKPSNGWAEDRWIYEMSDQDVASILHVPQLVDIASLLGYDLHLFMAERLRIRRQANLS